MAASPSASGAWRKPSSSKARDGSRKDIQRSLKGDSCRGSRSAASSRSRGTATSLAALPIRSRSIPSSSTRVGVSSCARL